ncbi:MAG: hypothetical protein JW867_05795 [Candidatus Omnitrophica bacterium]|nr:hypothetical protein [Candidatus Omnitrophota bacterium]
MTISKEKEFAYDEFLKSMRVALTNTSVYFKEHPLYIKAVKEFKDNIEKILPILNPIVIGITQHSLLFDNEYLKDNQLTRSIAEFFHLRKVKSIEFKEDVSTEDLNIFLSSANLSSREIISRGGLNNILSQAVLNSISVRDLDYSRLLKSDGVDYKDMWLYLLRDSIRERDHERIKELADNFERALTKLTIEDILTDKETSILINNFFVYLKDIDQDRFLKCANDLSKTVLKAKKVPENSNYDSLKKIFGSLSAENLSQILLLNLESEKKLDNLSFDLFSKLIDQHKHTDISSLLADKFRRKENLISNPHLILKMRSMFSNLGNPFVVEVYRRNLSFLLEGVSLGKGFSFDYDYLNENYRYFLLEIFNTEINPEHVLTLTDCIVEELDKALTDKNPKFIKNFIDILDKKLLNLPADDHLAIEIQNKVSSFAEQIIFSREYSYCASLLYKIAISSSKDPSYYLDQIFTKQNISEHTFRLFFKFFPGQVGTFYKFLEKEEFNSQTQKKIIDFLDRIDPGFASGIARHIFLYSSNYIKQELLQKMIDSSLFDEELVFSIIKNKKGNYFQRRQALKVINKYERSRKTAPGLLLDIKNPLGLRTKTIYMNLQLIKDVPMAEAQPYLQSIIGYRFFWNRRIRVLAKEILKKLDIRE